jgi:hypothetical protein
MMNINALAVMAATVVTFFIYGEVVAKSSASDGKPPQTSVSKSKASQAPFSKGKSLITASSTGKSSKTCIWEGKAPACNGKCRAGYTKIKTSKKGDGKKCITGTKAYCCKTADVQVFGKAPICNGKCPKGWTRVGDSDKGEKGKKCKVGKAAQCVKNL